MFHLEFLSSFLGAVVAVVMEIIVCDADESKRKEYAAFISGHVMMAEFEMEIVLETADAGEVVNYVKSNPEMRLYFLEIDLQSENNGLDLAYEIRNYDNIGPIVYITDRVELMALTFEYGLAVLGFIVKSDEDLVRERLVYYLNLVNERFLIQDGRKEKFVYKSGFRIAREEVSDILFFQVAEKGDKRIEMHTKNGVAEFYGKIAEIETKSDRFFRCDRSCVVNVDNISTINVETGEIEMVTGDICRGSVNGLRNLRKFMKNITV